MNKSLQEYQAFIDDLVKRAPSVTARAVLAKKWSEQDVRVRSVIQTLNDTQREVFAELIQRSREGGIHDTLAYLTDEINLQEMEISRHGTPLAVEPYWSEMYYDWTARLNGDEWPEPEAMKPEYATEGSAKDGGESRG